MKAKLQERGATVINLKIFKPVLRAYALGYASSTIPRLFGWLRALRRRDRTVQEKLDLVCLPEALLLFLYSFITLRDQPNHPYGRVNGDLCRDSKLFASSATSAESRCLSLQSSITSSKPPLKSTASQHRVQSLLVARPFFLALYASSYLLSPSSSAVTPPYCLRPQPLGSTSFAPSSPPGLPSICSTTTQAGLANVRCHAPRISFNLNKTHQTSTTDHPRHRRHSLAKP